MLKDSIPIELEILGRKASDTGKDQRCGLSKPLRLEC